MLVFIEKKTVKTVDKTRKLKIRIRSKEEIEAIKRGQKPVAKDAANGNVTYTYKIRTLKIPLAIHKRNGSKAYTIKLNSRENLANLFHYFYDGVDESIYLSRKYKVFIMGLESQ